MIGRLDAEQRALLGTLRFGDQTALDFLERTFIGECEALADAQAARLAAQARVSHRTRGFNLATRRRFLRLDATLRNLLLLNEVDPAVSRAVLGAIDRLFVSRGGPPKPAWLIGAPVGRAADVGFGEEPPPRRAAVARAFEAGPTSWATTGHRDRSRGEPREPPEAAVSTGPRMRGPPGSARPRRPGRDRPTGRADRGRGRLREPRVPTKPTAPISAGRRLHSDESSRIASPPCVVAMGGRCARIARAWTPEPDPPAPHPGPLAPDPSTRSTSPSASATARASSSRSPGTGSASVCSTRPCFAITV